MKPGELRRWKTEQFVNFEGLFVVVRKVRGYARYNDIWEIFEGDKIRQMDGSNLIDMSELIQEAQ